MSPSNAMHNRRAPRGLAASGLLLLGLSACNNPEYWSFKEEVILNTGQRLQVQRKLRRNNVWPHISADGYRSVVDGWVSEPTFKLEWQASKDGGQPISIGVIGGKLTVAFNGWTDCRANPKAYAVELRQRVDSRWVVVEQSNEFIDGLTPNMMLTLEWGEPKEPKATLVSDPAKRARDERLLRGAQTLRQYLDGAQFGTCAAVLRWLGNSAVAESPIASAASGVTQ